MRRETYLGADGNIYFCRSHLINDVDESDRASESLPLVIRERDIEYQFRRVVLYKRLLQVSADQDREFSNVPIYFKLNFVNFRDIRILKFSYVMKLSKTYLLCIGGEFGQLYWMSKVI